MAGLERFGEKVSSVNFRDNLSATYAVSLHNEHLGKGEDIGLLGRCVVFGHLRSAASVLNIPGRRKVPF